MTQKHSNTNTHRKHSRAAQAHAIALLDNNSSKFFLLIVIIAHNKSLLIKFAVVKMHISISTVLNESLIKAPQSGKLTYMLIY